MRGGLDGDLSKRKQAEAALRISQEQLRAAADVARLTYIHFDLDNNSVHVAENFSSVMGYEPLTRPQGGPLERARLSMLAHVEEADRTAASTMVDEIFAGRGGKLRFRVRGDDGAIRWFDCAWGPKPDGDGNAARVVFATLLDVTSAVEAQLALGASKAKAEEILASITDGFCALDSEGRYVYLNERALRHLKRSHEELIGRDPCEFIPGYNGTTLHARFREALARREPVHFEAESLVGQRWLSYSAYPTREGGLSIYFRDLTDQKRAEVSLRSSQERLQLATEATGAGVWEWNVAGNFFIVDAQIFRIYGVEPTPDGIIGYDVWASLVLREDLPQQEELVRKHLAEGGVSCREFRIRRPHGEIRTIEAVESLRYDTGGRVEAVVGTNLDITERKQAEAALRTSQGRLLNAANAARLTYTYFDLDRNRVRVAENFESVMGYKPRTPPEGAVLEVARRSMLAHAGEFEPDAVSAMFDQIFAGVGGSLRFRLKGDDGAIRWFDCAWDPEPAHDDAGRVVFATVLDVTTSVEAQRALGAAKAKADEILASIGDGFYALDAQWRFTYFNHRAEEMLGKEKRDVVGQLFFDVFPMVRGTEVHANYSTVIAEGRPLGFEIISPIMKSWVAFSVYPTSEGGISVYFRGIEQQKAAEASLVAAKAEAERANVAKSKFLAAVSHDLRQPVQALVLQLALIERQVTDNAKAIDTARRMIGPWTARITSSGRSSTFAPRRRRCAGHASSRSDSCRCCGDLAAEYGGPAQAKGLRFRAVLSNPPCHDGPGAAGACTAQPRRERPAVHSVGRSSHRRTPSRQPHPDRRRGHRRRRPAPTDGGHLRGVRPGRQPRPRSQSSASDSAWPS